MAKQKQMPNDAMPRNTLGVIFPDAQPEQQMGVMGMTGGNLDDLVDRIAILVARKLAVNVDAPDTGDVPSAPKAWFQALKDSYGESEAEDLGQAPKDPKAWFQALKDSYKKEALNEIIDDLEDEMEDMGEEEDVEDESENNKSNNEESPV